MHVMRFFFEPMRRQKEKVPVPVKKVIGIGLLLKSNFTMCNAKLTLGGRLIWQLQYPVSSSF